MTKSISASSGIFHFGIFDSLTDSFSSAFGQRQGTLEPPPQYSKGFPSQDGRRTIPF
jgi:hypothetical protein